MHGKNSCGLALDSFATLPIIRNIMTIVCDLNLLVVKYAGQKHRLSSVTPPLSLSPNPNQTHTHTHKGTKFVVVYTTSAQSDKRRLLQCVFNEQRGEAEHDCFLFSTKIIYIHDVTPSDRSHTANCSFVIIAFFLKYAYRERFNEITSPSRRSPCAYLNRVGPPSSSTLF